MSKRTHEDWQHRLACEEAALAGAPTPDAIAAEADALLPDRVGTHVRVESCEPAGAQGDMLRFSVVLLSSKWFTGAELWDALQRGFERKKNRHDD
jgi:hypothetical protein